MTPGFTRRRRAVAAAVAVGTALGFAVVAPATTAQAATPSGTILYDKGGNVWQILPDGTGARQVTTNGGTPTSDNTGSTGYTVPTESSNGVIVAIRNQDFGSYTQGFLWVMDRTGHVIRKFKPPQFNPLDQIGSCPGPLAQFPNGINTAVVSPDGKHIAYTALALGENLSTCEGFNEYASWVVNIDGTGGQQITDGSTTTLETGHWASNTRLLVDNANFGSIENFYVDLPSLTITPWSSPSDFIDEAYLQPDVANGVLATDGYSETSAAPAIRLWSTTGFNSQPSFKCEYDSIAHPNTTDVNLNQPSLSPDGAEVVFEDYQGNADASNEGIYIAPAASTLTSASACTNATQTLFVQGAEDPFWTPASITQAAPDLTPPSVSVTGPTATGLAATSTKVTWSGTDSSGIAHYDLRYRRGAYNTTLGAYSAPSSWQDLTGTSLTVSLAAGYEYCFSVRATDKAGNTSAWSSARCTASALDDRSLTRATSGWKQNTGSSYYDGTVTYTTSTSARLTRTGGTSIERIGVVARTCSTCGKVGLYVGSTLIGTVNLAASSTHYKVVKMLSAFSARSGTVTVKSLTSGKLVAIDGLVISHN